ncbi:HAD-IA family hydrolase [Sphingorhabdus sp.]|jgi:putative hydrolase of the HAD superfamily|uniref:HAD-IA family hydrolase n=1 Tax=Sphingorhabdus sp. TaxID=1902408 RepID=UPI003BB0CB06|nr:HAD-IA family hydrolase [Sphingomonadales bacterium]MBK9431244.1 HAD-IA family hydrolase [Sphingomonadales bacterium]MBL0021376.1 HAD-IA family hydrolase [Sphingomonadales bacterium]
MAEITHIIFDFGGVITSSPFDAFNRMEAERGLPHNFVRQVNASNPDSNAWAKFERAEINGTAFDALFAAEAEALGHSLDGASVLACLSGDVRPAMVTALDRLKEEGFGLGCITNNVPAGKGAGMAGSAEKAALLADIFARFDHVVESSKAGIRKPDPRIYAMMCEALSVPPEACIYLDDLGINCKPAAAMGMAAIKVSSGEQALAELGALLGMEFAL